MTDDEITAQLEEMVRQRAEMMRRGFPPNLAEMILELSVLRGVSYSQIARELGCTKQAVVQIGAPLRAARNVTDDSVIDPTWKRPYAGWSTKRLLTAVVKVHKGGHEPDQGAPKLKATEARIKDLAEELRARKWSVDRIAAAAGVGRSTLARMIGWHT